FDVCPLKDSLSMLAVDPDSAMKYLYARLFTAHPGMRGLYPHAMTHTRAAVFAELARLIGSLDDRGRTKQALVKIAADHRKFRVHEKHYQPFFAAVAAMVEHVAGPAETPEMVAAWRSALAWFAAEMASAADADAKAQPAWWTGEIVQHERRTETVAVLTIRP